MDSILHQLPTAGLRALSEALRRGRLGAPISSLALSRVGLGHLPPTTALELQLLAEQGLPPAAIAWGLERLVAERELQLGLRRAELVWTGPEVAGSASRDTSVVVRELLCGAERTVLLSTYAIYGGAQVFKVLAERMQALPHLSVRLFVNVSRPSGSQATEEQLVRAFAAHFVAEDWPGDTRLPELFFDPRALSAAPGPRAVLHAKCIVVDDSRAFVTSANFTEAAQERNIEAGILVHDPAFACALRDQFESLAAQGTLRRLPCRPREPRA